MFSFSRSSAAAQAGSTLARQRPAASAGERLQQASWFAWWRSSQREELAAAVPDRWEVKAGEIEAGGDDTAKLVAAMIRDRRYALLLRPEIATTLDSPHVEVACEALDELMSLVPEGTVCLRSRRGELSGDAKAQDDQVLEVEAFLLDRYAVTNADYQRFVDAGGYQEASLWDANALPAIGDFIDQTQRFGPRYWTDGKPQDDLLDHPVVGVCWYEAAAYARWAGKRLPDDAEWVKAAAWPISTTGTRPIQKRYPWGDMMDRRLTNIWGSRGNTTAPVTEYAGGVNGGGAYQLAGNVWEWTDGEFGSLDLPMDRLETETPFKSLRGGAFDTYFESQATAQFQCGDSPLARKPNIGFRCAISCDAVLTFDAVEAPREA